MISLNHYFYGLTALLVVALLAWTVSLRKREVSFVDSLWPLFFIFAALIYAYADGGFSDRAILVLALVSIWGLRLSAYITWRNWGQGEDSRYQEIRDNNQPNFWLKSLYLVFGLQALLAWIISMPLWAATGADAGLGILDAAGALLWLIGFVFEAGGDYQLAKFKSDPDNKNEVLNSGLWRYTRHPNYFGDFCVWWGFYLFALSAGAWWTLPAPLLMSVLLMKVSGVTLTEKSISKRRPGYDEYVEKTNTFFPGPPKKN